MGRPPGRATCAGESPWGLDLADFDARTLLNALPDAAVAADASQRILFANRGMQKLLGWAPADLAGRQLSELIPPPHQMMELDTPMRVRAARPDGSVREVDMILSGDVAEFLVATLREPPRATETEDSARQLRAILETISVGVLLAEGPNGRLTVTNTAADRIAGEPVRAETYEEFVAKFPLERLDGRLMELSERPLARTFEEGRPVREVLKYQRRDGREIILEVTTAPFPGPSGGAVTTFSDVTSRYEMEQDLGDRAAQLRALLDHLPVGVAYFDKMAVCRAGNAPARRFLNRTRAEIIGVPADELFAQAPPLREALHRCVRDHVSHVQPRVEWPDSSRPSAIRYLEWQFEPLSADPAKPRGALALITDVTERTHIDAQKQLAMEAAEGASKRKTQFLSAVSHDLRTPVNALSLQAELLSRILEMREEPGDELILLAGDIRSAAGNLIELINDLLDLTRFDSGAIDYRPTDFVLDDWLGSTLAPLALTARTKNLGFTWGSDRPHRIVHGDRVKLGRVLTNLVGNAVKFTEKGEVRVIAGADPSGWLKLEVRDTGPGIPADQVDRIFDEFSQLRNPERDRTKGTGLGLAICRRLVEGVGGRLILQSEPGKGSTFTALYPPNHLPQEPPPDAATQYVVFPSAPDDDRADSSGPFAPILLVEDDQQSRNALRKLLEHEGYTVRTARDGLEALDAIRQLRPSLILLDLMMPGMDGSEVLRRIRRDPDLSGIKVVILTGDAMDAPTSEIQTFPGDAILSKPVSLDALRELLSFMLPTDTTSPAGG
jgi:PAS domain S-box-containing protein